MPVKIRGGYFTQVQGVWCCYLITDDGPLLLGSFSPSEDRAMFEFPKWMDVIVEPYHITLHANPERGRSHA